MQLQTNMRAGACRPSMRPTSIIRLVPQRATLLERLFKPKAGGSSRASEAEDELRELTSTTGAGTKASAAKREQIEELASNTSSLAAAPSDATAASAAAVHSCVVPAAVARGSPSGCCPFPRCQLLGKWPTACTSSRHHRLMSCSSSASRAPPAASCYSESTRRVMPSAGRRLSLPPFCWPTCQLTPTCPNRLCMRPRPHPRVDP